MPLTTKQKISHAITKKKNPPNKKLTKPPQKSTQPYNAVPLPGSLIESSGNTSPNPQQVLGIKVQCDALNTPAMPHGLDFFA